MKRMLKKPLVGVLAAAMILTFTPVMPSGAAAANAAAGLSSPAAFYGKVVKGNKVKLSWSKVKNAKKYVIYRGGKTYKTVKGTSFIDKKVKKSKTYKYRIKAKSGAQKSAFTYAIRVKAAKNRGNVKKITVTPAAASLVKGTTRQLTARLTPAKKLVSKKVVWTSSDDSVATVTSAGLVKGIKDGSCSVTARAVNGRTDSCSVTVTCDEPAASDVNNLIANIDEPYARDISTTLAYDEDYCNDGTTFRNAGSDAEHAAAKYLASQFKKIGLTDVEKVPVTVDKWQAGECYLKLSYENSSGNTENVNITDMVPYASDGTLQDKDGYKGGTVDDWSSMDIVDVGEGYAENYEGKDVKGKIVLISVNQNSDSWISQPYLEAYDQGAAAVISYQRPADESGGYGLYGSNDKDSWDTINIQDICAGNYIPCTSISPKDAAAIKTAISSAKSGTLNADLQVDNEVEEGEGTSYNVVGKIKGTSNSGQQIIYAGHYDKYFYGLNDDSTAIGTITGIAKAMKDSGYKPENDIIFVAHGAEEWGQSDSGDDWAIGSWKMITKAHPEWQGKTLALINFEMPAIDSNMTKGTIQTSMDLDETVNSYLSTDLLKTLKPYYSKGVQVQNDDQMGMSDCISYQSSGVPSIINLPDFSDPKDSVSGSWFLDRYHTKYDNNSTYSSKLMKYGIGLYGALGQYIDSMPALEIDMTSRCTALQDAAKNTGDYAAAGTMKDYTSDLSAMKAAGARLLTKAQDINARYKAANAAGASAAELAKIRDEGTALNKTTLKVFAAMQDDFMGLSGSSVEVLHSTAQDNIEILDSLIDKLQNKTINEDSILEAGKLNGLLEYTAYSYGEWTYDEMEKTVNCDVHKDTWGYGKDGKTARAQDTYAATQNLLAQFGTENPDYSASITGYKTARSAMEGYLDDYLAKEIKGMQDITTVIDQAL